jgi:hypothetical protein
MVDSLPFLMMQISLRGVAIGRPGVPHGYGQMPQVARMYGRSGEVYPDGGQQLFIPLPGNGEFRAGSSGRQQQYGSAEEHPESADGLGFR